MISEFFPFCKGFLRYFCGILNIFLRGCVLWGGCLLCVLSFPLCSILPSGDPSVGYADSSPRRDAKGGERHDAFEPAANLCRGALPLLGEVPSAHTGERGRRWAESAIRQKKERCNDYVTAQKPHIRVNFGDSTDSAPYKKPHSLSGFRRDCVRFMFACGCTVGSYIFQLRLQAAEVSTVGAVCRRRSADGRRDCGGT